MLNIASSALNNALHRRHTHTLVLMVDAEQYGKKLYMFERQMFRKHVWLVGRVHVSVKS